MGDVSAYTDAARLYNNCGKMVATVLTSVVTPPLIYYIILTYFLRSLALFAKASPLRYARLPWAFLRDVPFAPVSHPNIHKTYKHFQR